MIIETGGGRLWQVMATIQIKQGRYIVSVRPRIYLVFKMEPEYKNELARSAQGYYIRDGSQN